MRVSEHLASKVKERSRSRQETAPVQEDRKLSTLSVDQGELVQLESDSSNPPHPGGQHGGHQHAPGLRLGAAHQRSHQRSRSAAPHHRHQEPGSSSRAAISGDLARPLLAQFQASKWRHENIFQF